MSDDRDWAYWRLVERGWESPADKIVALANFGETPDFSDALRRYQAWAHLPATGDLDAATVASLKRGRFCGLPDQITTGELRRRPTARWRLLSAAGLPTVPAAEVRRVVQASFDSWSQVCPIQAQEADEGETPDLAIAILRLDGRNGVLADCQLPGPSTQRMRLDNTEAWVVALPPNVPSGTIALQNVLTHELGHFWGFGHHSGDTNSLMDAFYDEAIWRPQPLDVRVMQSLYPGAPAKPPAPTPAPPAGRVATTMAMLDQHGAEMAAYKVERIR